METYKDWHPNFPVNLANCQDEPIHIPGAIQQFGVLIGFDASSGRIDAISDNVAKYFPSFVEFESKPIRLNDVLEVNEPMRLAGDWTRSRRLVEVKTKTGEAKRFFGVRYKTDRCEVLEIETDAPSSRPASVISYLSNVPLMMGEIQSHQDIESLSDFVANKIKDITGFDRVMVYRYDHNWNGRVIAEAKEERLEPFLGLHYPASDIPVQARALYEKNWIRIIPTMDYKPSPIIPAAYQSIDLSNSVLRSVSPIHVRYLNNMGVGASMSISLMVDGQLWGLVACHHYSGAHLVPLEVRIGCEAYGQIVSWQIKSLDSSKELSEQVEGERTLQSVLQVFAEHENFKTAAVSSEAALLRLFKANGIIIRLGEDVAVLGEDPGAAFAETVSKLLMGRSILNPLVSDVVSDMSAFKVPGVAAPPKSVAGLLALSLSPQHNYYILCTRPEVRKSVKWAGNPHKTGKVDVNDLDDRLVPRGSFALWEEMHEGHSDPWSDEETSLLKNFGLLFFKIVIERKEIVERTNSELKALNQAKDEFVAMVSHELRTPLNAIIGWTDLALSGDIAPDKILDALKIIQRNARSQNQLVADLLDVSRIISGKLTLSVRNMRLTEVAEAVALSFQPAADVKGIRIITQFDNAADSIIGDPNRVQQVVWNLLSNAIKFSPKNSKIWVTVHRMSSHMELMIQDQGVGLEKDDFDKVFGRFQQVDSSITRRAGGLGLGLAISKHIVEMHGGRIEVSSEGAGKGSLFKVIFPISPVLPKTANDDQSDDDTMEGISVIADDQKTLGGEVILIVEDEIDASKFLKLLIESHGAKTYSASNGVEALAQLEKYKGEINIVLSDIGMPEMDGYTLVTTIRNSPDKQISSLCAVALTAFGRPQDRVSALKAGFDSYIAKPVMQDELIAVLETVCKARRR